ncbi:Folate-Biopterin Transporter (FBT) Family [Achlya hypogyna]|uniref:Folate-Biopterin Transporter (FBT) Family n=1 Tax=Achlya hypogyna TaxID=1202772 RepID=A0A1V9ZUQ7_ACHHY|nr:Folate-Biopterin Transporter (FBT) Family [Achlya hypogyna]
MKQPNTVILTDRASFLSSGSDGPGHIFIDLKSPHSDARSSFGALRDGPIPIYTSPEVVGVLAQYAAIGLLYGAMPNLLYPLFTGYFHMSGAQYNSGKALISIGWSVKVFVGMLSDCVPIFGHRRKYWMAIGWLACLGCMIGLATMDMGDPYYPSAALAEKKPWNRSAAENLTLNTSAPEKGGTVAILMGLATLAYIFADVPADALVVEIAQREPLAVRGRMQTLIYATRTIMSSVSVAVIAVGLNSYKFSGDYDWDMGVHTMFYILGIVAAIMVPVTLLFVQDHYHPGFHLGEYLHRFWQVLQKRATWQVMIFNFLFTFLSSGITSTAAPYVMHDWADASNFNYQVLNLVGNFLFALGLSVLGKWGMLWNWRAVLVATTLSGNAIDALVQFTTIFDVLRNQWWYLGVPLAENLPFSMQFIVTTFIIVELAEEGSEGIMYGLMTTVSNMPAVLGPVVANAIFSHFDVEEEAIVADSDHVRAQVAWTYGIYYGTTVLACFCVVLLPNQKIDLQHMLRYGGKSATMGGLMVAFCFLVLVYSIAVSLLGMFAATSCLPIAGGQGCSTE